MSAQPFHQSTIVAIQLPNLTYDIHFDSALAGTLVFSEVSLGAGQNVSYTFDKDFTLETCGEGYWGGGCFVQALGSTGNTVLSGPESSGSLEFAGPIQDLSFTVGGNSEYWNGFDLGELPATSPVPEPGTLAMVGTGIFGLLGAAKRKLLA